MDGCNVLPETQFVGTRLHVDTTQVLSVGGSLHPLGAAGERSECNIKPPLGALLIFHRGYLLKSFPRVDTSARQQGFEIRVFPLWMQWSITLLSMVKYQKIKVIDTKTRDLEAVTASAHKAFGSIHLLCCCNEVFPITLETNVLLTCIIIMYYY